MAQELSSPSARMMTDISDHKDRTRLDHATSATDCELKRQDGNKSHWANSSVSAIHKALLRSLHIITQVVCIFRHYRINLLTRQALKCCQANRYYIYR